MNFIWRQIEQIRAGGIRVLWRKIRILSQRLLRASKYGRALAVHSYKLAVILRPESTEAYINLGRLLIQLERDEEAIECWRKAMTINPDLAEGHIQLVETLIRLGRFDEAFVAWQQAFMFKPDWPQVHSRIQNVFYFCGQMGAARSILQRVVDSQNDFAKAHQLDCLGIRFLREFPTAIGHIALLDNYVKRGILSQRSPAHTMLLVHPEVANPAYLNYWRRYLPHMVSDPVAVDLLLPFARYMEDSISVMVNSSGKLIVDYDNAEQASIQSHWEAEGRSHLLALSDLDNERGWHCLQNLGVPRDAWFVGLHVRQGRDISRGARDVDISTYRLAIESIVARGGWVIRMGDPSMTPLPPMPQVIDYVHSEVRSDWMDVFLWARCRFFIATISGPAFVPPTFGVPCVATNWHPLLFRRWFGQDLFIPKLLWSENEKRYLPLAEALGSIAGVTESLDALTSMAIRLVDNTPEEINDVVVEMLDRLEGKLKYSEQDEQLQEQFDRMWISNAYKANGRIGRAFLRKWAHLL